MVRVVLVDDHPFVREGLVSVLSKEPDLQVVGETDSAEEAIPVLARVAADVVVLDIRLPGMSGVDACVPIRKRFPDLGIVILTSYTDDRQMVMALAGGARGFIRKESPAETLGQAIRAVARGGTFIDPDLASSLVILATHGMEPAGPYGLTRQEMKVLALLPRGFGNREIGERLGLSRHTVKTHVSGILRKLQAKDRAQAAAVAVREKLV